jgi:hypothetical protein
MKTPAAHKQRWAVCVWCGVDFRTSAKNARTCCWEHAQRLRVLEDPEKAPGTVRDRCWARKMATHQGLNGNGRARFAIDGEVFQAMGHCWMKRRLGSTEGNHG